MNTILMFSVASFVISFLLGSIPWGVIISKTFYRQDIREHGSGNIGATNAFRTMGKVGGVAVLVLDFLKGLFAGWLAMAFAVMAIVDVSAAASTAIINGTTPLNIFGFHVVDTNSLTKLTNHIFGFIAGLGLLGAISGHIFSPWLRFKGGKGIAVAAGCVFFVFGWLGLLIEVGVFLILIITTRYVSVGSLSAAILAPFIAAWVSNGDPFFIGLTCCVATLAIWAHRGNIARLRAGNENRIGAKKQEVEEV